MITAPLSGMKKALTNSMICAIIRCKTLRKGVAIMHKSRKGLLEEIEYSQGNFEQAFDTDKYSTRDYDEMIQEFSNTLTGVHTIDDDIDTLNRLTRKCAGIITNRYLDRVESERARLRYEELNRQLLQMDAKKKIPQEIESFLSNCYSRLTHLLLAQKEYTPLI